MLLRRINAVLLLTIVSYIILDTEICSYYNNCSCTYCGEDNNFTNCNYINLFCDEGENYFQYSFGTYKNLYMNYFNGTDEQSFCGKQKNNIDYSISENILVKTGNNYIKESRVHCYYEFGLESFYYNLNPQLIFEIIDGKNKLHFNLITVYIMKENWYTYAYVDLYTDEDIRNGTAAINISEYDSMEFYIDFKENQYSEIGEALQIKVTLDKIIPRKKDSDDKGTVLGSIFGTIGGIIILLIAGVIIYNSGVKCDDCCRKEVVVLEKRTICKIF